MKNRKGFTLIEILAVIIIIGIIAIIAIPSISKYLNSSKDSTYTSYERSMEAAAKNRIIDCLANNEHCEMPEDLEEQKIYLDTLIEEGYLDNMKDPETKNFCEQLVSYVSVQGSSAGDYKYKACLYCGDYYTDDDGCSNHSATERVKTIIDPNGNPIGKIIGDKVTDINGNPIGTINDDNKIIEDNGDTYGTIIGDTIYDENGEIIGTIVDASAPVCGTTTGTSTRWTNQNRTVTVGCSSSTVGCLQTVFSKTFTKTTKFGVGTIVIRDRDGNYTECGVNAYVDKTPPTCSIQIEGDKIESVGWYSLQATGKIQNMKDGEIEAGKQTESGLLTYGMGTSIKTREYNKKESITVGSGITTIIGYVKDVAGNEGVCAEDVKVGTEVPKFNAYYGYIIYPNKEPFLLDGLESTSSGLKVTGLAASIKISNTQKYKNVEKVKITLNSAIPTTTMATLKAESVTKTAIMQQGSKEIEFVLKGSEIKTYENFEIKLGELQGKTYNINKIELLTKDGSTWTDKDITMYVYPDDAGLKTSEVSFEGGVEGTWTTTFQKTYTGPTTNKIVTRNRIGMVSAESNFNVKIDKVIPSVGLVAKRKSNNVVVSSNQYVNEGLNYTITHKTVGISGAHIYYCKDTNGTCNPTTETTSGALISEFNNITTDYKISYRIVSNAESSGETNVFSAKFDLVKPVCSFGSLPDVYVGNTATVQLTCTDPLSKMDAQDLTASSFTLSNNNMSITGVTKQEVTNGYKYTITLSGLVDGNTTITLKENMVKDRATNYNSSVTSNAVRVKGVFLITLNNQSAKTAGTTSLYELYNTGWYSDASAANALSKITIPTKDGNTFEGYFTATNGGGTKIIDNAGNTITSASTSYTAAGTAYARWDACPVGSYCKDGVKTACPSGMTSSAGSVNKTDCKITCSAGQYLKANETACTTCPAGSYCSGGTYNFNSSTTQGLTGTCQGRTKYSAAGSSSCSTVSSGYYTTGCDSSNNKCTGQSQCTKGNYCSGGVSNACGAGKYSDTNGATSCSNIVAGCYGTSGTSSCPNECPGRTKYSAAGSSSCSTVSSGYYTTGCNGSNNRCTGQSQCTKGNYCSGGVSNACGAGKYSDTNGATSCSNIVAGCYGTSGTSSCPNECKGRTKYSAAGKSACSDVSSGYYTTGCNGSNNRCTGQSQCTKGNYCSGGVSYGCGAGKYSSSNGATSCSNISAGCYGTSGTSSCPNECKGRTKYSTGGASGCSSVSSGYYTTGCNGSSNRCTGQTGCTGGNYCSGGVSYGCGTGYTSGNYATSCYDYTTPTINGWKSTCMTGATANASSATFRVNNLGSDTGSGLKTVQYYTNCNGTQSASISGNAATLTISSCSRTLYYRLCDERNCSGYNTVGSINQYAVIAMAYNQLLWPDGTCAANNDGNIAYHVERNVSLSQKVRDVGYAAASNSGGVSNGTFVTRLYRGIVGRDPDTGGYNSWVNSLNAGTGRSVVVNGFTESYEAKNIYSSWGSS